MQQETVAPSIIALDLGKQSSMFAVPRAMIGEDIVDVVRRFATTLALAEHAGFTGVEIHAAPGYLLSQFLSPLANHRTDRWGGSLDNRARLPWEIVRAARAAVAPSFAVAVKLDLADFQRGGFSPEDARAFVAVLAPLDVDLVELSGGATRRRRRWGRRAMSVCWRARRISWSSKALFVALFVALIETRRRARQHQRWIAARVA